MSVNRSKLNFWLVTCIAKNLIRTTLKVIFSIFRFFCILRFQIFKYYPIITNHTSIEILFIQLWWSRVTHVVWDAVLCCVVLCCVVLCCVVLCCVVLCCVVLCCVVLCCGVVCCVVMWCAVLCCAVLCCAVLCCVVLCCDVMWCDVMCVLSCPVLQRAVFQGLSQEALSACIQSLLKASDIIQKNKVSVYAPVYSTITQKSHMHSTTGNHPETLSLKNYCIFNVCIFLFFFVLRNVLHYC